MTPLMRWPLVKRTLVGAAALVAAIQFVPVERSNPVVEAEAPAPPAVRDLLRRACYDCHSNETVWPAYSRVAPVSWLLARDVREGRRELNFSTWNQYSPTRLARKLKETREQIETGEMPPWFYLLPHPDAALSPADIDALRAWIADAGNPPPPAGP